MCRCGIKSMRGVVKVPLLWCDVYSHYWMTMSAKESFPRNPVIFKPQYGVNRCQHDNVMVPTNGDAQQPDIHAYASKRQWRTNAAWAVESYGDHNSLSITCKKLSMNALLAISVSEHQKLAGVVVVMVMVMVMGFIEDECTFSTITYMNARLQNSPHEHLDLTVQIFVNCCNNCSIVHSTMLLLNGSKSSRDTLLACVHVHCLFQGLPPISVWGNFGHSRSNPSLP